MVSKVNIQSAEVKIKIVNYLIDIQTIELNIIYPVCVRSLHSGFSPKLVGLKRRGREMQSANRGKCKLTIFYLENLLFRNTTEVKTFQDQQE